MTKPPKPPVESLVMTAAQVAEALQCDADTVYTCIREGRLPAVNIGTRARPSWRIAKEAVERWLREGDNPPERPARTLPWSPLPPPTLRARLGMRPKRGPR